MISFDIQEVHLPATLQKALNQKITAQQQAEQQKYQLEQAKVRTEQDRVVAEGQANAMKEQAKCWIAAIYSIQSPSLPPYQSRRPLRNQA